MPATVEDLLQQIGHMIVQALPVPWQQASVEVLFEDDVTTAHGLYLPIGDAEQHSFPVPGSINRLFGHLRGVTRRDGHTMWSKATLIIQSDNSYTIDFNYDD